MTEQQYNTLIDQLSGFNKRLDQQEEDHQKIAEQIREIRTALVGSPLTPTGLVHRMEKVEIGHANLKTTVYRYRNIAAGIVSAITVGWNVLMFLIKEIFTTGKQ